MNDLTVASRKQTNSDDQGPVKIFLSYASEDEDIMIAVSQALERLRQLSNSNIRVVYDKKSLEVGAPAPLIRDITEKLLESDYLVILYTGSLKKSFSWTGTELGIFWGFIRADERDYGSSQRQIIAIYFDEKPPVDWGALGIDLEISALNLRLSRGEFKRFVANVIRDGQHYASLVNTLSAIGAAADARLPAQLAQNSVSAREWQTYVSTRSEEIVANIVPDLMARLHDSFKGRVKRTNVEQRLIEFRIPKTFEFSEDSACLPDETVLVEHGEAFSLFKVGAVDGMMTWSAFKSMLKGSSEASWIIGSIERSAISAISPDIARDDEQIIRSPDTGSIFRLIITRRFEFYDCSKLVHMYFIPALRFAFLETSNTAVTLGFINIAIKYRDIFIDPTSDLSVLDYYRQVEFDELRAKVRRSIRELLVIEDESHILKLDERKSIAIYYDPSLEAARKIGDMQGDWMKVRSALLDSAQLLLKTPLDAKPDERDRVRNIWIGALSDFVTVSEKINSNTLSKAIDNLKRYLFGK
jgi:TIR domain